MATSIRSREGVPMHGHARSIVPVIGAVALLVIGGAVLALIGLRMPASAYPAHSPEATVQTYLGLLQNGKIDQAYGMTKLTPAFSEDAGLAGFHRQWDGWSQRSHRITLVRSNQFGGQASVTVDITPFSPGDLLSSEQARPLTFTLQRLHGTWHITGPSDVYIP